ncbi:MAG: class I tRNA ligase family protein, partial [Clostridia bacterium]|nr:class I tRNA ligase family protein [Clostridia bacterium]
SDLYLEGLDQYRGWFQSSLLTAVGAMGAGAPFKECATHGWVVDGQGKAMHKSLGNGVDPAEVFKKYGADILRLWAGSAEYHADVRCSDNIFKQLAQNYLKFRNTARYCLGNLDGFDPNNLVKAEEMLELDRWAITKLNELTKKCFAAYDNYDFHVVSHAINDFCVVELSSFYLDIIKDRLYCEEKNGLERRSAQTALWIILDTITKLFAPILCFTCDEIWLAMPHRAEDDVRNVLFNEMNKPFEAYDLGDTVSWSSLIMLRDGVNAALEKARAAKQIGKPLEAHVTLIKDAAYPNDNLQSLQEKFESQWADLFIVSDVEVSADPELYAKGMDTPIAGVRVLVEEAKGEKCPRCWKHHTSIGTENGHEELCPRCAAVVAKMA